MGIALLDHPRGVQGHRSVMAAEDEIEVAEAPRHEGFHGAPSTGQSPAVGAVHDQGLCDMRAVAEALFGMRHVQHGSGRSLHVEVEAAEYDLSHVQGDQSLLPGRKRQGQRRGRRRAGGAAPGDVAQG